MACCNYYVNEIQKIRNKFTDKRKDDNDNFETAGSGLEYSNKYDDKSNRLFSYYLMRGLINNNSDMQRLYDFVKSNVQERSYEMGASYEQVPVYDGNIRLGL